MNFTEFNLDPRLLEGIEAIGYEHPTPIQEMVIPVILKGSDLIGSAQTGTGKTAAFLLPLINKIISEEQDNDIKALIIVPTRELAVQIEQHLEGIAYFARVGSISVYGGGDGLAFSREQMALSQGTEIVICTPGRMISHLNMGNVSISELKYLVLDEADRMLDMGFYDDIMKIISFLPKERQTLLFSATMPTKIRQIARKILINPVEINIALSKPPEKIKQEAYIVYNSQKIPLVSYILSERKLRSVIVFCSTKQGVKDLTRELKRARFSVSEIHSDLEQHEREKVLLNFKNRTLNILVATDILSRGIDIEDIDLVINYDVPNDGEDYVHRIGRTARAENDGLAMTLVSEKEQGKFSEIEDLLGNEVPKMEVPERFGKTPEYNPKKNTQNDSRRSFGKSGFGHKRNFRRQ
jgi:superfamily II DNA/RNA helicase